MNRQEKIQVEKEKQAVSRRATDVMLLATIVGLKKSHGFGKKRIERTLAYIMREAEIMASGMIGLHDYQTYAEEFTKFKLEE